MELYLKRICDKHEIDFLVVVFHVESTNPGNLLPYNCTKLLAILMTIIMIRNHIVFTDIHYRLLAYYIDDTQVLYIHSNYCQK